MKGSEIKSLWKNARDVIRREQVARCASLGNRIRYAYDVLYNGYSVCTFREREFELTYEANCCENPWQIEERISIGGTRIDVNDIVPTEEYDVPAYESPLEKFLNGKVKYSKFSVYLDGNRSRSHKGDFDSFEAADSFARNLCQERIDYDNKDPVYSKHTADRVEDDAQRAREHFCLRYYLYYRYEDYRYWISVEGT